MVSPNLGQTNHGNDGRYDADSDLTETELHFINGNDDIGRANQAETTGEGSPIDSGYHRLLAIENSLQNLRIRHRLPASVDGLTRGAFQIGSRTEGRTIAREHNRSNQWVLIGPF